MVAEVGKKSEVVDIFEAFGKLSQLSFLPVSVSMLCYWLPPSLSSEKHSHYMAITIHTPCVYKMYPIPLKAKV